MADALRTALRFALAAFMVFAGVSHLVASDAFLGQLPPWLPARTAILWISGLVEIALGLALVLVPEHRREVGWALAIFFVCVFPGNLYQAVAGTDAFGLDTPVKRWGRLLAQPALVAGALWCTGAWPRRDP